MWGALGVSLRILGASGRDFGAVLGGFWGIFGGIWGSHLEGFPLQPHDDPHGLGVQLHQLPPLVLPPYIHPRGRLGAELQIPGQHLQLGVGNGEKSAGIAPKLPAFTPNPVLSVFTGFFWIFPRFFPSFPRFYHFYPVYPCFPHFLGFSYFFTDFSDVFPRFFLFSPFFPPFPPRAWSGRRTGSRSSPPP